MYGRACEEESAATGEGNSRGNSQGNNRGEGITEGRE